LVYIDKEDRIKNLIVSKYLSKFAAIVNLHGREQMADKLGNYKNRLTIMLSGIGPNRVKLLQVKMVRLLIIYLF